MARRHRRAVVAASIGGCVSLEMKERELVFRPIREAAGWYSGIPDGVQELYLPVARGRGAQRIHAWWWPADDPEAPVVYYLHGVRWNLTGHLSRIPSCGASASRCSPSTIAASARAKGSSVEESVYEDARVGWQWLDRAGTRRVAALHLWALARRRGRGRARRNLPAEGAEREGLIVESSFTSLAEMAAEIG